MKTSVSISPGLIEEAMKLSGASSKHSVVEEALRTYVQMLHQTELLKLRGQLPWDGDLDQSRLDT